MDCELSQTNEGIMRYIDILIPLRAIIVIFPFLPNISVIGEKIPR